MRIYLVYIQINLPDRKTKCAFYNLETTKITKMSVFINLSTVVTLASKYLMIIYTWIWVWRQRDWNNLPTWNKYSECKSIRLSVKIWYESKAEKMFLLKANLWFFKTVLLFFRDVFLIGDYLFRSQFMFHTRRILAAHHLQPPLPVYIVTGFIHLTQSNGSWNSFQINYSLYWD